MIEACIRLEFYDELEKMMTEFPDNSPYLIKLGEKFQLAGLCKNAVKCYERCG